MRRYSPAVNPIQALRERWGLGDTEQSQSVPSGEGPDVGVHPLPTVTRERPAPYSRPLPGVPGRPFFDPGESSSSGAVDYAARQRSQLDDVPKGGDASPITVYPNWESRLEGMRDFLGVLRFDPGYSPIVATPGVFDLMPYTVPQGYTAFWKQFRFFFDPIPAPLTLRNTLITLLIDGLVVPDYFNLPLGPMMESYQECFPLPIAEGRRLSLRIAITQAVGDVDLSVTIPFALLYGNVRPRTGESEGRDVGVRAPAPTVMIAPPPPPPPPIQQPQHQQRLLAPPPPPPRYAMARMRLPPPPPRGGNNRGR